MSLPVPDWMLAWATSAPDAEAVSDAAVGWSAADLAAASRRVAAGLADAGAGEGSRVATLLGDGAPAVALVHATRLLGAVLVPLNRRAAPRELTFQVSAARVGILVHDEERADLARAAVAGAATARWLAIDGLLEASSAAPGAARRPGIRDAVALDAPAAILFTSGTSGRPKGAILTHANLAASADAWSAFLDPRPTDRWLACLPLFHVAGLSMVVRTGRWNVPLEIHARFDPAAVDAALDAGVSHVSLVPSALTALLEARRRRPVPPTLRAILLGGGPIPPALIRRALDAGLPVCPTYGLTESASGVTAGAAGDATTDPETSGRPLPGAEIRVASDGEILVRGTMVFAGYADDERATAAALREGWLHTGDLGVLGADGRLTVLDRRDDLFASGGENVYPAEVEAVLLAHPAIADAAVVGRPDPRWGTVPVAAVVLRENRPASDDDLALHCRERLASYKVPTAFHRLAALPRGASGKLLRRAVRDMLAERSA